MRMHSNFDVETPFERLPAHLILDSPPELRELRKWVAGPPMPTVDIDWFYSQLFASVQVQLDDGSYRGELYGIADRMAYGDLLWGHSDITFIERDELCQRIIHAGEAIIRSLMELRSYNVCGFFPYRFKQYRNDGVLVFERTDSWAEH